MNSPELLLCVTWPMILALATLVVPTWSWLRTLVVWAALPTLLLVFLSDSPEVDFGWLVPGARLGMDGIAQVLLPVTASLWLAAGIFAAHYLPRGRRQRHFFVWFLLAMTGNFLLLAALDVVMFYLGFALMSFSAYGLVVHTGDARARHAGRYYMAMVVVGEVCVLSAVLMLASYGAVDYQSLHDLLPEQDPARTDLIAGLLLVGFGIKVGIFGLHFWLPLAHPVAPAPASAVLSGAMIKAGVVAWMRLLPLGHVALEAWGLLLVVIGLVTAFYGVLAGLPQREAKTVLAYSSISQMGILTLAIGVGLMFPDVWPLLMPAVLIFITHHSLVKGSLFLSAGLASHPLQPALARATMAVMVFGAVALAGGVLTGGMVAKTALKQALDHLPSGWPGWLSLALTLSSMATATLMLRFLYVAWPRADRKADAAPVALVWVLVILAAVALVWPWLLVEQQLHAYVVSPGALWAASWPLLLAVAAAWFAWAMNRRGLLPGLPVVPAGDLGIALERVVLTMGEWLSRLANDTLPRMREKIVVLTRSLVRTWLNSAADRNLDEVHIMTWTRTAAWLLSLAVILAWLMMV
jgi:formate hydrogenlyase subunit 3/multisubunit Na+/H+ antiporter MnhD subunit